MFLKNKTIIIFLIAFSIGYLLVPPVGKKNEKSTIVKNLKVENSGFQFKEEPRLPQKVEEDLPVIAEINSETEENQLYKIKLLETGDVFHGDEIDAKDGETWLGLFENNGQFTLSSTKLKIRKVHDSILDDTKKKTGKSVSVRKGNEPIFLINGAKNLTAGRINTFFKGVTWTEYLNNPKFENLSGNQVLTNLDKNFSQNFKGDSGEMRLSVIEGKNKEGKKLLALELKNGANRQILHTILESQSSEVGILYWVGDLDRDGLPDFFLELYEHDNVDNKVLYLSSEAEQGKLVKKVAYFWTTGC